MRVVAEKRLATSLPTAAELNPWLQIDLGAARRPSGRSGVEPYRCGQAGTRIGPQRCGFVGVKRRQRVQEVWKAARFEAVCEIPVYVFVRRLRFPAGRLGIYD